MKKHNLSAGLALLGLLSSASPTMAQDTREYPPIFLGSQYIHVEKSVDEERSKWDSYYVANNLYEFKPEEGGLVDFYTESSADTYGILFDADKNFLIDNDDYNGSNYNFMLSHQVTGGHTYYLGVRFLSQDAEADYVILWVKKHEHKSVMHYEAKPSTCLDYGQLEFYTCGTCGQMFADEALTTPIHNEANPWGITTDPTLPMLPHQLDATGQCILGCGLSAQPLTIGEHTIDLAAIAGNPDILSFGGNLYYYTASADETLTISTKEPGVGLYYFENGYSFNSPECNYHSEIKQDMTYLFGFKPLLNQAVNGFTFTVRHSHPDAHTLQLVAAKQPTCDQDGWNEHYVCTVCGEMFSDADGETPVDPYLNALGHAPDADGKCQREGCSFGHNIVGTLVIGENTVEVEHTDQWNLTEQYQASLYRFVAPRKGELRITSEEESMFCLYREDCRIVTPTNFCSTDIDAETTYYIGLKATGESKDYKITLQYVWHEGECQTEIEGTIQPTCTAPGRMGGQVCQLCGKLYNADGYEIENATIPALGHDLGADGKCQREGCTYEVKTISLGKNTLDLSPQNDAYQWHEMGWFGENIFLYHAEHTGGVRQLSYNGFWLDYVVFDATTLQQTETGSRLESGKNYYIGLMGPSDFESHPGAEVEFYAYHDDEMHMKAADVLLDRIEPGCLEPGYLEHWKCAVCGENFRYADDGSEMYVWINPIGHDMHDGKCSRCDFTAPVLKTGSNTISLGEVTSGNMEDYLREWWFYEQSGNIFSFVSPGTGKLRVENKGSEPIYICIYDNVQNVLSWEIPVCEDLCEEYSLFEGQNVFIGIMAKSGQALTDVPVFVFIPQEGDINHDGVVNVADVTALANKILEKEPADANP